ncbi:MAG: ATP synthase subunit I [Woeseiaceae bacterium]
MISAGAQPHLLCSKKHEANIEKTPPEPHKKRKKLRFFQAAVVLPCTIAISIMRGLNTGPPGFFDHDATHRRLADGSGVFNAGGKPGMDGKAEEQTGPSPMSPMLRVLLAQLGLGAGLAVLFWGVSGSVAGYSALLGGLTCVIPNAFLALRLAVPRRDPGAAALVRAAYIGELGKLALTVLMFSIVFLLVRPLSPGALFGGFIGAQLVTFAGFLMRDGNQGKEKRNKNGE